VKAVSGTSPGPARCRQNERLRDEPNLVNEDPYGDGWLIRISGSAGEELLDATGYRKLLQEESA
jgi:glycine cleavage system H protein